MIVLFNKPYGVLSQFTPQSSYESLGHYIPFKNIYPVGRLDADSEGLLILTDNGNFQNKLSDPSNNIYKTYWVQVENIPNENALNILRNGMKIQGYITKPALAKKIVEPVIWDRSKPIRVRKNIPTSWIELGISEGKNRQIRKMTAAIFHPSLRLIRIAIGDYKIENLAPGEYRVIES